MARAAEDAGAVGVIIVNNDEANPDEVEELNVSSDEGAPVGIPVVMVSFNAGKKVQDPTAVIEFKGQRRARDSCAMVLFLTNCGIAFAEEQATERSASRLRMGESIKLMNTRGGDDVLMLIIFFFQRVALLVNIPVPWPAWFKTFLALISNLVLRIGFALFFRSVL